MLTNSNENNFDWFRGFLSDFTAGFQFVLHLWGIKDSF